MADELIAWGIGLLLLAANLIMAYVWGRLDGREQERRRARREYSRTWRAHYYRITARQGNEHEHDIVMGAN